MASNSLFFLLRRYGKCSTRCIHPSPAFRGGVFCRLLSSGALRTEESGNYCERDESDDLKSRIFSLRLPKRSATNVLQRWIHEGNSLQLSDLRHICKELRKSRRYKHALEMSEWMVSHKELELSDSDYALRIDLMNKVFGIDAAERYFDGLPNSVKTCETYTSLLHSYAGARLIEKAEELFDRIKESNLPFSALTYNEMMTLYMSVGQVEKVALVIEELKSQMVEPDLFTYNLWASSCAATLDIDGVKRILLEMSSHPTSSNSESWARYMNLVNIYVTAGHLVNSQSNSLVEAEKGITQREWITYDFLILLYGSLGDKEKIDQIWKSLKMTKQKMTSRSHICILTSHLMLGHINEAGNVIDQWKVSMATDFDISICNRLLKSFTEIGLAEKAEALRMLFLEKSFNLDQ